MVHFVEGIVRFERILKYDLHLAPELSILVAIHL